MMMIDKRVLPLAIGGLGIGTTEFTIMGLLPDIAHSMNVTIPEAGHFISAYALGVVVGAPLLTGYAVKFPPKTILIGLMTIFTVFNGLSALAPNYTLMLILRFLSGLPHGAFFGVGSVVASQIGGKGKEARYIAFMFAGLTIANLAMVPLVTYIGHVVHWRWYFAIVSIIGLLTIASLLKWLPYTPAERKGINLSEDLRFLKSSQSWFVLTITAIGFGGLFAWFSYITPLMTEVVGVGQKYMAYVMVLAGAGMVVGNLLGGFLSDLIGAAKAIAILQLMMVLALIGVFLFSSHLPVVMVLTFACGGLSMSVSPSINILIMKAAPGAEMMAAAFIQAAFNLANALGAYLGGLPLEHGLPYNYPSIVGAGMTFIGFLTCLGYIKQFGIGRPVERAPA
jgi:DHA1 family arabinose polymer transporter-like MFS transporter